MAPSECLFLTAVPKTEFAPVGAARSRQQQRQGTRSAGAPASLSASTVLFLVGGSALIDLMTASTQMKME